MDLNSALHAKRFDIRLFERNVQNGAISQQDVEKYLRELPDLSSQSERMKMDNSTNTDKFNQ